MHPNYQLIRRYDGGLVCSNPDLLNLPAGVHQQYGPHEPDGLIAQVRFMDLPLRVATWLSRDTRLATQLAEPRWYDLNELDCSGLEVGRRKAMDALLAGETQRGLFGHTFSVPSAEQGTAAWQRAWQKGQMFMSRNTTVCIVLEAVNRLREAGYGDLLRVVDDGSFALEVCMDDFVDHRFVRLSEVKEICENVGAELLDGFVSTPVEIKGSRRWQGIPWEEEEKQNA